MSTALHLLHSTIRAGRRILLVGCGGSAADCEHIAGELLKTFRYRPWEPAQAAALGDLALELEPGIPAIALPSLTSALTAYANDRGWEYAYAQLVLALGEPGDLLWALSTSGRSPVIVRAAEVARARGLRILAMTGPASSPLSDLADVTLHAPAGASETFLIQEHHLRTYHALCAELERLHAA